MLGVAPDDVAGDIVFLGSRALAPLCLNQIRRRGDQRVTGQGGTTVSIGIPLTSLPEENGQQGSRKAGNPG
ncbi:MAG: hypothetical protein ACK557_05395, partial [Planctomycetota bacterium]